MHTRARSSGGADGPDGAIAACLLPGSTSILHEGAELEAAPANLSHPIAFAPGCPRPDNEELMASPVITCPKCVKKFKGRDDLAGKKIKCPFCAQPFMVPRTAAQTAIKAPAKEGAAKPAAPAKTAAPAPPAPIPFADDNRRIGWDEEDNDQNPY